MTLLVLHSSPKCQRNPASNQAQPSQRRDRAQHLKPLRVEHQQVDTAAEHRHAGDKERGGDLVLWRNGCREQEDAGVDELIQDLISSSFQCR